MNEKEFIARQEKARRQTIFGRDGKILSPGSETKRSICNVHLILAHKVEKVSMQERDRKELLKLVNEAYNLGKRMATKLDYYNEEPVLG